jgi:putative tryptophan/tyrosine transport system substrate-binding protein
MQFDQLKRRDFITVLGGAAAVWATHVHAQQAMLPVIGFLGTTTADEYKIRLRAFREGLALHGLAEGENVRLEYRWADAHLERLPQFAAQLVQQQVSVIVAGGGTVSALAARAATPNIPIIFASAADPVAAGLVASLNRPGGNITGVTSLNIEVAPKRLEVMHELLPSVAKMALLINPTMPALAEPVLRSTSAAAQAMGINLQVLHAISEHDFDSAFQQAIEAHAGGLVIGPNIVFTARMKQLADLTVRHAMPAVYEFRDFATFGGLMSYGSSEAEYYRLVGTYAGRIIKGDKPADLPVQQVTKVELIINLNAAKRLGINVPLPLLGRADEVIE